jgi:hypothetical protein
VNTLVSLQLRVPGLIDRPAIGTSCCVTTADAMLAQELWMTPGVEDVRIDGPNGLIELRYDPQLISPDQITTGLAEVGYPAAPTD